VLTALVPDRMCSRSLFGAQLLRQNLERSAITVTLLAVNHFESCDNMRIRAGRISS
jgi:hypothetical protein